MQKDKKPTGKKEENLDVTEPEGWRERNCLGVRAGVYFFQREEAAMAHLDLGWKADCSHFRWRISLPIKVVCNRSAKQPHFQLY